MGLFQLSRFLKQGCHKPALILSIKAQKPLDAPARLPTGTQTHPPRLQQPCFPAVKMQPLLLADEHPQGTTRTIFSETSIRRSCFITSLFLSHGFQLSDFKDLRGISQKLNKPIKLHLRTLGRGSLCFEGFNSSHFCALPPSSKNITVTKHENQRCSLQTKAALFSERGKCWFVAPVEDSP